MRVVVTDGCDRGRYVVVDMESRDDPEEGRREAAEEGVAVMRREWPDEFDCRTCEGAHFNQVHLWIPTSELPFVFEIGSIVEASKAEPFGLLDVIEDAEAPA